MGPTRVRNLLLCAAIASYLAACAMPALRVEPFNNVASVPGWLTLMLGWLLLLSYQFAWLANVLGLGALIASGRRFGPMPPLLLSAGAVLLAQHTWLLVGTRLVLGDDGHEYLFTAPDVGFYLWVIAFVLVGVASRFGPSTGPI